LIIHNGSGRENVMFWWPGWNSIEGTTRWGDVFFWIAVASLVTLVGSEVVYKFYEWRKDYLIAITERTRAETQERKNTDIEARHTAEVALLQDRIAEALLKAAALESRLTWRSITQDQRVNLVSALRNAPKGPVIVMHVAQEEPWQYARQITDALRAAGFTDVKQQSGPVSLAEPGEWILVLNRENAPAHAVPIQSAFKQIGVDLGGQSERAHVPTAETVVIMIGEKRFSGVIGPH
jgi:hypothetical protein